MLLSPFKLYSSSTNSPHDFKNITKTNSSLVITFPSKRILRGTISLITDTAARCSIAFANESPNILSSGRHVFDASAITLTIPYSYFSEELIAPGESHQNLFL
ncbi:MAG: hypothetical protein Q8N63_05060 [Nanoarchaeota archaeon]|nr:hypothetical protein [Nanoarchaeota archaeon]